MSNERKTLKGKTTGTGRYHVTAKFKGITVYTTIVEAPNKQKATDIVFKKATAGKLVECGITPKTHARDVTIECKPVRSATLSEMIQNQKKIDSNIFPPHFLN